MADMSKAPERIYLQHDVEDMSLDFPADCSGEEVTWCAARIAESDVEYVRADVAEAYKRTLAARVTELEENVSGLNWALDMASERVKELVEENKKAAAV